MLSASTVEAPASQLSGYLYTEHDGGKGCLFRYRSGAATSNLRAGGKDVISPSTPERIFMDTAQSVEKFALNFFCKFHI